VIKNDRELTMIDFKHSKEIAEWRIKNDSVMGGKSKGSFLFDQDHGVFTGYISLDNNGGFSSVFKSIEPLCQNIDTVTADILGDGHKYQLRIVTNSAGYRLSYSHEFNTISGQRERLKVHLADCKATFRGRLITSAPALKPDEIHEIGFLIAKTTAGEFSLSVYSLMFLSE
jgi:hypothetical protein